MFHWWMPSQLFLTVASNALSPHTLEELGLALSVGQLTPSKDYETDARCPRTLLPVAQCLWITEGEHTYYFLRLNPWLRIPTAPKGDTQWRSR